MKNSVFLSLVGGLAVLLFLVSQQAWAESLPIKIGAIVSLTGDAAKNGRNWLEGAQLAIDDLNGEGIDCKLVIEDDQTRPLVATTSFNKLVTADQVQAIVGGTWDFLAEACFPLAERFEIPFITPTNPVEVLSVAANKNRFIFTNGLSMAAERKAMKVFLRRQSIASIGLVYIDVLYGQLHAQMVEALARDLGISIAFARSVAYEGYRELIRQAALNLKRAKPEMVFAVLNYEGIDILLREIERLKFNTKVLMTHTLKEAWELSQGSPRYKDAFGVLQVYESSDFEKKFLTKYGHAPYGYAGPGYDAVQFLVRAIASGVKIGKGKRSFTFKGVTGVHLYPPTVGRALVETKAQVMIIRDGELVGADSVGISGY